MAKPREDEVRSSPISLHQISPCGPALTNHVGCIIGNVLYVHGGISKYLSKEPLNALYRLDLGAASPIWTRVLDSGSPSLSHHACVVIDDRYILLIGGWNGKVRSSDVWAYDTHGSRWLRMATSGFPDGAGLSSHAALPLDDGGILVVGREGSARIQRRYGNSWILRGSVRSGRFAYAEHGLALASRSGHTMHAVGSELVIIGGRCDRNIELHAGYRSPTSSVTSSAPFFRELAEIAERLSPLAKAPCGRKQHVSVSGRGLVLLHGGETFDGKCRHPVGDFYLISVKPTVRWYHFGSSGVGRAGHVCCATGDKIVIHGGLGPRMVVYSDTYEIKLTK